MPKRSLSEILSGIDTAKVEIDANGRIRSTDPDVEAHLNELRDALGVGNLAEMTSPDGVQCHCGGGGGGPQ